MAAFVVKVKEESIKTRLVTVEGDLLKTKEDANRYIAEALQNVSFDDLDKFPISEQEYSIDIDGEIQEHWLE